MSKTQKLLEFTWEGTNKNGAVIKGELTAMNLMLAKSELRRQGVNIKKIRKKSVSLFGGPKKQKIKTADIATFSRQMATMLSSGIPLVQAFEIVGKGVENKSLGELVFVIKSDIEAGSTFAEALRKHPKYFNDLYCNLVNAGEQSGSLETMLDKVATYAEKTEAIKGKIKKAMFYPTAVLSISFLITAGLMIWVVPQFESLFSGFGADLPGPTKVVMQISKYFQAYWWLIFGGIGGGFYSLARFHEKSAAFRNWIDRKLLELPIFGVIFRKASLSRFCRTLETTIAAGLPLVDALEAVSGATGNIVYGLATLQIKEEVSTGQQLQLAIRNTGLFPSMVVQMIAIGEESGSLEIMLSKVADIYEREVDDAVDSLSSLMEPIIMVVLGVLVGGIVVAMYLPIFKLGSAIK